MLHVWMIIREESIVDGLKIIWDVSTIVFFELFLIHPISGKSHGTR